MDAAGAQSKRFCRPASCRSYFAAALETSREHCVSGAVIYATVPSASLKYFIQGLKDGGFTYRHCLIWIKQAFVLGRSDYHYQHEPILYGWLNYDPHYFIDYRTQSSVFESTVRSQVLSTRPASELR